MGLSAGGPSVPSTRGNDMEYTEYNYLETSDAVLGQGKSIFSASQREVLLSTYGPSFRELTDVPKSFKNAVAVTLDKYPEELLTKEQTETIQRTISENITRMGPNTWPLFTESYESGGVLVIICENDASRTWLLDRIPKLTFGPGIAVVADSIYKIQPVVMIMFDLPPYWSLKDMMKQVQHNPSLKGIWCPVRARQTEKVTMLVEKKIADTIREKGWKLRVGLECIQVTDLKKIDVGSGEVSNLRN